MGQRLIRTLLIIGASGLALAQPTETASFEIADAHVSTSTAGPFKALLAHGGRCELKSATMVDLIRTAYNFDGDRIVDGPSWLEMDRFDVVAKVPVNATPNTVRPMLQSLLADRFGLAIRREDRPFPAYVLTVGRKIQITRDAGGGEIGCRRQSTSGNTVQYSCRNMTMAALTETMPHMAGLVMDRTPVVDQTGLRGQWKFDLAFMPHRNGLATGKVGDQITLAGALDEQLGLKIEERQVPMPAIVVNSVSRQPTKNRPGAAEALALPPAPKVFEVATVKISDPGATSGRVQLQPGGGIIIQNQPLRSVIGLAFQGAGYAQIVTPKGVDTTHIDINAKAEMEGAATLNWEIAAPMIRALLVERFKMAYHEEERPVDVYALVAAKPKMQRADPAARTWCKEIEAPVGSPTSALAWKCQNITMAQFADRLQLIALGYLDRRALDATGLDGGWDLTLVFVRNILAYIGRAPAQLPDQVPAARDPDASYTFVEALEKELGLKLESRKRPMQVIVIDHLEQKPIEN
jgi:uncharacterized protein (TIGR03435 family)